MPATPRPPRRRPLLRELHAHTSWSDGELGLNEIVELYSARGFDVLCITDHVVRAADAATHAIDELHPCRVLDAPAGARTDVEVAPAVRRDGDRRGGIPAVERACAPDPRGRGRGEHRRMTL